MEFGEKIRKLRKARGLNQDEVAKEVGLSRRAYVSYESGGAKPRKRETYEKLAASLGCEADYLLAEDDIVSRSIGLLMSAIALFATGAASASAVALPATVISGLAAGTLQIVQKSASTNSSKKTGEDEDAAMIFKRDEKKQKKFRATALGILVMALSQKGIVVQVGNAKDLGPAVALPEEYISIKGQSIDEWWFRFWAFGEIEKSCEEHLKYWAESKFISFCAAAPDPRRKVSIIVDDEKLFDQFRSLRRNNSYRGNLSVILIDTENARIEKEELLSSFDIDDTEDKLSII